MVVSMEYTSIFIHEKNNDVTEKNDGMKNSKWKRKWSAFSISLYKFVYL